MKNSNESIFNLWQAFKFYLNTFDKTEIITRQELLKVFGYMHESTIDKYRKYLTNAKYIIRKSRGVYKLVKKIPHKLTLKALKHMYYEENAKVSY